MSSLPNNTFASPGNPFYALIDNAPPGPPDPFNLQSPASVLPDANGVVTFAMIGEAAAFTLSSTSGAAGAKVNIVDNTGNDAVANLQFNAGGNGLVQFSSPNTIIAITAPTLGDEGQLQIGVGDGNGGMITKNVIVDVLGNRVTLGDPLTAVGTTPSVTVTQPLVALQSVTVQGATPGTGITLQGSGTIPSIIAPGALTIGTVDHSNILTLEELPSVGAVVAGTLGVQGNVTASGSVTATNVTLTTGSTISTLSASGAGGILNISSGFNDSPAAISISDANVSIKRPQQAGVSANKGIQLSVPPSSLPTGSGGSWSAYTIFPAVGGGYTSPIVMALGGLPDGAYFIGGGVPAGQTPNAGDLAAAFTTFVYITSGAITAGGTATGPPNTWFTSLPFAGSIMAANVSLIWNGGQTSSNYRVLAYPINGPIVGMQ